MKPADQHPKPNDIRVLRELVREEVERPVPALDWDAMEARLMAELYSDEEPLTALPIDRPATERPATERPATERPATERPATEAKASRSSRPSLPNLEAPISTASVDDAAELGRPSQFVVTPKPAPARTAPWLAAVLVAASLVGIYVASDRPSESPAQASKVADAMDLSRIDEAPGMPGQLDLRFLREGDVVEATVGPVSFVRAGAVRFELGSGGRLVVRKSEADSMALELEAGSLSGQVLQGGDYRLSMVAGEVEIGGQGGPFDVTVIRSSKHLAVDLKGGQVELRSGANLATLVAPIVGTIALDGARAFEALPPPRSAVVASVAPIQATAAPAPMVAPRDATSASAVATMSATAPQPGDAEVGAEPSSGLSPSAVRARVVECIASTRAKTSPEAGVSVRLESTLRVTVAEGGQVKGVQFNPPLEPSLQGCAVFLLRETITGGSFTVPIQL